MEWERKRFKCHENRNETSQSFYIQYRCWTGRVSEREEEDIQVYN